MYLKYLSSNAYAYLVFPGILVRHDDARDALRKRVGDIGLIL